MGHSGDRHRRTRSGIRRSQPGDPDARGHRLQVAGPFQRHLQGVCVQSDRNEPDVGEANHLYLLDVLDRLGYEGYVGLEYKPKTTTVDGLGWAKRYGIHP